MENYCLKTWLGVALLLCGVVPAGANWPSFRGERAAGVADGARLPKSFDVDPGEDLRFKVRIPGLAHSCPILWEDRLFLTTAVKARLWTPMGVATFL